MCEYIIITKLVDHFLIKILVLVLRVCSWLLSRGTSLGLHLSKKTQNFVLWSTLRAAV